MSLGNGGPHYADSIAFVHRVLAGTTDGRLFLIERGELKSIQCMHTFPEFDPDMNMSKSMLMKQMASSKKMEIKHLQMIKNGFIFVVDGCRAIYYRMQSNMKYGVRVVWIGSQRQSIDNKPSQFTAKRYGQGKS